MPQFYGWGAPPPYGYGPMPPYPTYGLPPNPSPGDNPMKDLKRSLRFWRKFEKEMKEEEKKKEKPKTPWKDKVETWMLLAVLFPVVGPLYILAIKLIIMGLLVK